MRDSTGRRLALWFFLFVGGYGSGLLTMALWPPGPDRPGAAAEQVGDGAVTVVADTPAAAGALAASRPGSQPATLARPPRPITDPRRLIRAAVARYSEAELLTMITAYTRLAPHDLPEGVAVAEVAERLADIYYGDSFERAGNPLDNPGFVRGIEFDVSKAPANRVAEPREYFAEGDKRIYASFDTADYGKREVMVKWSRVDSPEVLIYDKYPIMAGMDHNYVWLEQPQGWEAGKYQVDIYSLAGNLSLLARGSYEVD